MRSILREPLFHFLLIGAFLFVVFNLANDQSSGIAHDKVLVSGGRIEQLTNIFARTWQRPPTREELQGLVDDYVLEEIYYRQAVAMGIDRDDTIIRRRLRQKLEFLTDDVATAIEPTDEDLSAYLAANEDVFRRQSTYTFEQVYINPDGFSGDLEGFVAEKLTALRAGEAPDGGIGLLPPSFEDAYRQEVDGSFGLGFSVVLDELPTGQWLGPFRSGLGLHLVRLEARVDGTVPELDEIRPVVAREWANAKRIESRQKLNEMFLEDYEVVVEWPAELEGQPESTQGSDKAT